MTDKQRKKKYYEQLLREKIKLQNKINKLGQAMEYEWLSMTGKARKLRSLRTQLNYTEIEMGRIKAL